jgi:acyl carrier protein
MHYKAKVDSIYSIGTSDKAQEKVNREVNDLLAEVLNIPSRSTLSNVEKGSSLVNLGADSLSAIKLTHLIYERYRLALVISESTLILSI